MQFIDIGMRKINDQRRNNLKPILVILQDDNSIAKYTKY